jgi:hypothetical protein
MSNKNEKGQYWVNYLGSTTSTSLELCVDCCEREGPLLLGAKCNNNITLLLGAKCNNNITLLLGAKCNNSITLLLGAKCNNSITLLLGAASGCCLCFERLMPWLVTG